MEPCNTAYLDIRLSTVPGTLWRKVCLLDDVTRLGRPEANEPGVDLELRSVSRKHGRIFREGQVWGRDADRDSTWRRALPQNIARIRL
jgi:hypothetical protein